MTEPICCGESRTTILWKFADKEGVEVLSPCVEIEVSELGSWYEFAMFQSEGVDGLFSAENSLNDSDRSAVYTLGEPVISQTCDPPKRTGFKAYRNGVYRGDSGGTCNNPLISIRYYYKGDQGECEIVAKLGGKKIWSVRGKCPASYNFACGDNCPRGTMQCRSGAYPGYECRPCSQFRR